MKWKVAQAHERGARGDGLAFGRVHIRDGPRNCRADNRSLDRFKHKTPGGAFMPKREKEEDKQTGRDSQRVAAGEPSADAVFLIQIYEFHKVDQPADSRSKDQACYCQFRDEGPFRIEIAEDIPGKMGEEIEHRVAVSAR